jgi:hypothetical protein
MLFPICPQRPELNKKFKVRPETGCCPSR